MEGGTQASPWAAGMAISVSSQVWGPSLPSPSHSPTIRFKEDPLECPTMSPPMSAAKLAGLRRHGGRVSLDSLALNFSSPLEG